MPDDGDVRADPQGQVAGGLVDAERGVIGVGDDRGWGIWTGQQRSGRRPVAASLAPRALFVVREEVAVQDDTVIEQILGRRLGA